MNIGLFTDTYFPQVSGVSTSIQLLYQQLKLDGHNVTIFTTTDPNQRDDEVDLVRLPSIPFISFDDRRVAVAGFDKALKIAREKELDIVHTHTEFSLGLAGRYVASRFKIPTVHTYHTMYENYTHYIWNGLIIQPYHVKVLSRLYCQHTDGVIAPSNMTKVTLEEYGIKSPIEVIPTGITLPVIDKEKSNKLREELGIHPEERVLLSLSRLSKEKKIDQVIQAYYDVAKVIPLTRLVIVGDGPERQTLENQVKQLNIPSVNFIGEVPHCKVKYYYQMADLYVNASESESQGLTYLESIGNGTPIIAKQNDYLKSIMENSDYGQLYQKSNELVDVLVNYLNMLDRGMYTGISQEQLESISAERFAEHVIEFYDKVIASSDKQQMNIFERVQNGVKDILRDIKL